MFNKLVLSFWSANRTLKLLSSYWFWFWRQHRFELPLLTVGHAAPLANKGIVRCKLPIGVWFTLGSIMIIFSIIKNYNHQPETLKVNRHVASSNVTNRKPENEASLDLCSLTTLDVTILQRVSECDYFISSSNHFIVGEKAVQLMFLFIFSSQTLKTVKDILRSDTMSVTV